MTLYIMRNDINIRNEYPFARKLKHTKECKVYSGSNTYRISTALTKFIVNSDTLILSERGKFDNKSKYCKMIYIKFDLSNGIPPNQTHVFKYVSDGWYSLTHFKKVEILSYYEGKAIWSDLFEEDLSSDDESSDISSDDLSSDISSDDGSSDDLSSDISSDDESSSEEIPDKPIFKGYYIPH